VEVPFSSISSGKNANQYFYREKVTGTFFPFFIKWTLPQGERVRVRGRKSDSDPFF
jgi:hypothetical protein